MSKYDQTWKKRALQLKIDLSTLNAKHRDHEGMGNMCLRAAATFTFKDGCFKKLTQARALVCRSVGRLSDDLHGRFTCTIAGASLSLRDKLYGVRWV